MYIDENKVEQFVRRLWENPSLSGLSPLQKEAQLHLFIDVNADVLQNTMTSPAFFPGISWSIIKSHLKESITQLGNGSLQEYFQSLTNNHIDFKFIRTMNTRVVDVAEYEAEIGQLLLTLSSKPESRKELTGPAICIASGMIDRYLTHSFHRNKHISIALKKVQRLNMEHKQIFNFVKMTMLLRAAVHYYAPVSGEQLKINQAVIDKVTLELMRKIRFLPKDLILSGINSYLKFAENPRMEATSRLASIFSHRCYNMRSGMAIERGAETSDKSWFSVARKNYKFHGFDLDMLYELQYIAAENGW